MHRDDSRVFADALFAAFASFGTSQITLLIVTSLLWYGRFVAFAVHDSLQIAFGIISAITATAVFTAVSARRLIRTQWIAPTTFATLTFLMACIIYVVGFPGTARGVIDLSSFFCGCLLATIPLVIAFTLIRFTLHRLIYAAIPYILWVVTLVVAAIRG
jgi:uncharacterized membrane protein (UPF0136 family)